MYYCEKQIWFFTKYFVSLENLYSKKFRNFVSKIWIAEKIRPKKYQVFKNDQICPKYRPDLFDSDAAIDMLDTSLTPSALKKISKSVIDLIRVFLQLKAIIELLVKSRLLHKTLNLEYIKLKNKSLPNTTKQTSTI